MAPSLMRRRGFSAVVLVSSVLGVLALAVSAAVIFGLTESPRTVRRDGPHAAPEKESSADPVAALVAIADVAAYAELDGRAAPLAEPTHAAARAFDPARDGVSGFGDVMSRRYQANDPREAAHGGRVDLEKAGLTRKSREDLVEWRYLRNVRGRVLASPTRAFDHWRHTRLATERLCDSELPAATSFARRHAWRLPFEAASPVPVDDRGAPVISARELVRRRVHIWQPHRDTDAFLSRPTALCATLLQKPSRLEHALMQHALWGRYCDDHLIFVPHLPPDVTADTDFDAGTSHEQTRALLQRYGVSEKALHSVEVTHVVTLQELLAEEAGTNASAPAGGQPAAALPSERVKELRQRQIARTRWQFFREVAKALDVWVRLGFFEHVLFVDEDVYAVPENLYALLSEPAVDTLNALGTPLLLGGRMAVPPGGAHGDSVSPSAQTARAVPPANEARADAGTPPVAGATAYVNDDAFVMNVNALRLFVTRLNAPECAARASAASIDAPLAACLEAVGVAARDTADADGHDRFPVMSLNWLSRLAADREASWWYARYRPRPMPRGYAVLSRQAVALPLVRTLDDMVAVHAWLFERDGLDAYPAA